MAVQRTFSILKPDVTRRNLTGAVNQRIEAAGLRIVAQKRVHMTRAQAEAFYGVHRERPFFGELVEMMTAAPVVVQVLEGEDAIQRYRDVMGATNPEKAAAGTIRKDFALSMGELGATVMVYPPGWVTLPVDIFSLTDRGEIFTGAALTMVLVVVTLGLLLALERVADWAAGSR